MTTCPNPALHPRLRLLLTLRGSLVHSPHWGFYLCFPNSLFLPETRSSQAHWACQTWSHCPWTKRKGSNSSSQRLSCSIHEIGSAGVYLPMVKARVECHTLGTATPYLAGTDTPVPRTLGLSKNTPSSNSIPSKASPHASPRDQWLKERTPKVSKQRGNRQ